MVQISIEVDKRKLREVERLLSGIKRGVPKALSGAVNDVAKKTVTDLSRRIRERIALKKRDIDRHLKRTRATVAHPSAKVTLSESVRLGLRAFSARQTKRGVSYRIEKSGPRKLIAGAFIVERLGGQVFRRAGKGRFPIVKLHGLSPWGAAVKSDIPAKVEAQAIAELEKAIDRRVRFLLLKAGGQIQ